MGSFTDPEKYYLLPEEIEYEDDYCKVTKKDKEKCKGNYLNWYSQRTKKIDLAKEAISALINDNPDVQFGLTIFNQQETSKGKYGGNIYKALKDRDTQEIQSLVSAVNGLPPDTWTPLCDTYYEVYRYFTGQSVEYGLFSASRDTSVESNEIYQTPLNSCQNLYVIYD